MCGKIKTKPVEHKPIDLGVLLGQTRRETVRVLTKDKDGRS